MDTISGQGNAQCVMSSGWDFVKCSSASAPAASACYNLHDGNNGKFPFRQVVRFN
jgi:hypothetical protein